MQTLNHSHRRSKKSGKLCYIIKRKKPVESVRVITNRINLSENALPYCCVQSSFCADNEYLLKPCKNFELRELGSNVDFLSPFKAPSTTYHLLSDVARKTPLDAYNFIKVVYIHENENTLERNAFVSKCSVDEVPENIWKAISSEILTDIIFGDSSDFSSFYSCYFNYNQPAIYSSCLKCKSFAYSIFVIFIIFRFKFQR